jgi:hypothetical protein
MLDWEWDPDWEKQKRGAGGIFVGFLFFILF